MIDEDQSKLGIEILRAGGLGLLKVILLSCLKDLVLVSIGENISGSSTVFICLKPGWLIHKNASTVACKPIRILLQALLKQVVESQGL